MAPAKAARLAATAILIAAAAELYAVTAPVIRVRTKTIVLKTAAHLRNAITMVLATQVKTAAVVQATVMV